jgi:hypothetical protein
MACANESRKIRAVKRGESFERKSTRELSVLHKKERQRALGQSQEAKERAGEERNRKRRRKRANLKEMKLKIVADEKLRRT